MAFLECPVCGSMHICISPTNKSFAKEVVDYYLSRPGKHFCVGYGEERYRRAKRNTKHPKAEMKPVMVTEEEYYSKCDKANIVPKRPL